MHIDKLCCIIHHCLPTFLQCTSVKYVLSHMFIYQHVPMKFPLSMSILFGLLQKYENVPSVTYALGQKKRLNIDVLNCHKHNCLLILFILIDVCSVIDYYRVYVGRPVVKSLLLLFLLIDAFSFTTYHRFYVGHPVI
jgi:hypothetical protein